MLTQQSILIIDDQPDNFDVLETLLVAQNYQLYYAASGQAALENLASFQPDLILLDVMMPDLDGIEVCRRIKALPEWQMVPIMMVTALNSKTDLAKCLEVGADDFISKPVNAIELRARVHSLLRIKQQYDHIQSLLQIQTNTTNVLEKTLQSLRKNLASTLSHELNTPLHGILGTLSMLKDFLDDTNIPTVKKILSWANRSAQRLESLTRRSRLYLDLELVDQQSWTGTTTQFRKLAIQSELMVLAELNNRREDLVFALEDSLITIPENYLLTMLYELVTNALKFSEPDSKVLVQSQVFGTMFSLAVHDSGRGMTTEQIEQIGAFMQFEREFYEQQGIGMGLKIVQKIVDLAGGNFTVKSTPQAGTTVSILLPIPSTLAE